MGPGLGSSRSDNTIGRTCGSRSELQSGKEHGRHRVVINHYALPRRLQLAPGKVHAGIVRLALAHPGCLAMCRAIKVKSHQDVSLIDDPHLRRMALGNAAADEAAAEGRRAHPPWCPGGGRIAWPGAAIFDVYRATNELSNELTNEVMN